MPLHDHEEGSLDALATRVYGRKYRGQQTGDMLPNDSYHIYEMNEEDVADYMHDLEQQTLNEGHYLGGRYEGKEWKNFHAKGVNWIDYWLSLDIAPGDSVLSGYHPHSDTEDLRGKQVSQLTAERAAPTIHYILADLITRGELPYGRYLLHCWW